MISVLFNVYVILKQELEYSSSRGYKGTDLYLKLNAVLLLSFTLIITLLRGMDSAYERGGDARRKFEIKSLKETDLGVAQAFFDP